MFLFFAGFFTCFLLLNVAAFIWRKRLRPKVRAGAITVNVTCDASPALAAIERVRERMGALQADLRLPLKFRVQPTISESEYEEEMP